jgi:hypothetical protein
MFRVSNETSAGNIISTADYSDNHWLQAKVPGTVLNNLVMNKKYPEPYYGLNNKVTLKAIPDIHDAGRDFYRYWFRRSFTVDPKLKGKTLWLELEGINYIAHIWVNGKHIGDMKGMFRPGVFDVTNIISYNRENVIAIDVEPVEFPGTYETVKNENVVLKENRNGGNGEIGKDVTMLMSIGWDFTFSDGIRDRNTGIWRDINLISTGDISLNHPFVRANLSKPDYSKADITVSVDVRNNSSKFQKVSISGEFPGTSLKFEKLVELKAKEFKTLVFDVSEFNQLQLMNPRLWWPVNKGEQFLYTVNLKASVKGTVSDELTEKFGIREITSHTNTPDGSRVFYVNGKPLFVRGSNWIPEAMLRTSPERMEAEMRYTQQSGINMLRLWGGGISESNQFFELCDKYGILVWHEFWMTGDTKAPSDKDLYFKNVRETILRIRNHPSLAYYVSSNEQESVLDIKPILSEFDDTRGYQHQSECCGVHDGSPYKYENPMQYYDNTASDRGSRIDGFCPEYGTVSTPTIECLREMMDDKDIWPVNTEVWKYLDGNGFHNMTTKYQNAIQQFGIPKNAEDMALKGQLVGATAYRSVWENWNYNKFGAGDRFASGVLFWYHNSPARQVCSRMWDWSLEPNAALYVTQNALEPLHAQFDFIKNTVSVYNDQLKEFTNISVVAEVYNLSSSVVFTEKKSVNVPADSVLNDIFTIRFPADISPVHFIKLNLIDVNGNKLAETFYWRSTDIYKGPWTTTGPLYGSFQELDKLPETTVDIKTNAEKKDGSWIVSVDMKNATENLAFFIRTKMIDKSGKLIRPVVYSDNYLSLTPGDSKVITIELPGDIKVISDTFLEVSGWNIKSFKYSFKN